MKFKFTERNGKVYYDTCETWEEIINEYLQSDLGKVKSIEEVKSEKFTAKFMAHGSILHEVVVESENFAQAEEEANETISRLFMVKGDLVSIEKQKK